MTDPQKPSALELLMEGATAPTFFESVGRLIVTYAFAECMLHVLARKLSGLREDKARILFAGMRLGDVTNRVRGLLKSSKRSPKLKADIEACLQQFDIIGTERDKLVHRVTEFEDGAIHISNELTAKSFLAHEMDMFTMNELLYLRMDCTAIALRLAYAITPRARNAAYKKTPQLRKVLNEPWRYKPVPQHIRQKRTREKAIAKALSQPRASAK